jgi:hypothetical protein
MIPALFRKNRVAVCDELTDAQSQDLRGKASSIRVTDVENVDARLLPLLAWQYRVDFWRDDLGEDVKRDLIRHSVAWHRKKGTVRAVKDVLGVVGFPDARIIEFSPARERFSAAGGAKLDGSWGLDGSTELVPWAALAGMPYLPNWACFAVALNIAEGMRPGWPDDVRWVVEMAKPVRSWPLYFMNLFFNISARPGFFHSLHLIKSVSQRYPWCTHQLNGMWSLGNGGDKRRLDGSFLNGEWTVGGVYPVWSMVNLRQCSIVSNASWFCSHQRSARHIPARVGTPLLHLGRGWQVGQNHVFACSGALATFHPSLACGPDVNALSASEVVQQAPRPVQSLASLPCLDGRPLGTWGVGRSSLSLGGWRVSIKGVYARGCGLDTVFAVAGFPERLGRYPSLGEGRYRSLDGLWIVGAKYRLDGSWSLEPSRLLVSPKLGVVFRKMDGSWRLGDSGLPINGLWRLGYAGRPRIAA